MPREVLSVVQEVFPLETKLHTFVSENNIKKYGKLASLVRVYPEDLQSRFFLTYLTDLFPIRDNPVVTARPDFEGTARLMTDINSIPLRTNPLDIEKLQELATDATLRCADLISGTPSLRIVSDLRQAHELFMKVGDQEGKGMDNYEVGRKEGHPIGWLRNLSTDIGDKAGLNSEVQHLGDASRGELPREVIRDMLEAAGFTFQRREGTFMDKQGRKLKHFSGGLNDQIHYYLYQRLADALVWEFLKPLLASKGYNQENPFKPYVDIMMPFQWPIGYDLQNQEFIIATP